MTMTRQELEASAVSKHSGFTDDAEKYQAWTEYAMPGGETVRVLDSGFEKRNSFADAAGNVLVEIDGVRSEMPESALTKSLAENDTHNTYEVAVEYRLPGSDVVVHRSAHVFVKRGLASQVLQGAFG